MKLMDNLCTKLDEIGCNYRCETTSEGETYLSLGLSGDNFPGLHFCVLFDNDASAEIKCFNVCKFPETKNLLMLQVVNSLNCKYRWTTFSATPAGAVCAAISVEATEDTAVEILFGALGRINAIIDEAYPILMKALYA